MRTNTAPLLHNSTLMNVFCMFVSLEYACVSVIAVQNGTCARTVDVCFWSGNDHVTQWEWTVNSKIYTFTSSGESKYFSNTTASS